jgi:hypothetical protein
MFRSSLIAAGAVLLCSTAAAQQRLDPARMVPITGPIKDAGTVDVTTGKWTKPSHQAHNTQKSGTSIITVFKNNCTWTGGGYYAGFQSCEWNFDEGRVPSTSDPNAPSGAQDMNVMESFQFSYCTFVPTSSLPTGYDAEVAFYDNNNGNCVGLVAQQPPPVSAQATAYFNLAVLGLPGSTGAGFQACWLITANVSNSGWVMASDGEGTFNNNQATDKFTWAQAQNSANTPAASPTPDGFIITGEPNTAPGYGSCSYSIACGTDAIFGNTCGTGLDAFDNSWINVDGVAAGSTAGALPACPDSVAQYGFGTNCYYFGGWPTNPFASYWLVLKARGDAGPDIFCTARTTSCGSVPTIGGPAGSLDLNAGTGTFNVTNGPCPDPPAGGPGILIHTAAGEDLTPSSLPFGFLCINTPFFRGPVATAVSGGPTNCDANYTWNFGLYAATNAGLFGLVAGNTLHMQPWCRDPANSVNPPGGVANLSTGLATDIVP